MSGEALRAVTVVDWDGIGWGEAFWRLVARLETSDANPRVVLDAPMTVRQRKDGTVPPVAVVSFDGNKVRDTWVHGWACNAGYVASITW